MIGLLKILSILSILLAIAAIVLLGIYILGEKPAMAGILTEQGAVAKFKAGGNASTASTDKIPPLVSQAKAFANKINPPPPPIQPGNATTEIAVVDEGPNKTRPIEPPPRPTKFKLVATCRYENHPEKSLALINLSAMGNEWFVQGEKIEHLTLHEVKDGSVILYQSGRMNAELFMPEEITESLLKSDAQASATPQTPINRVRSGSRTSRPIPSPSRRTPTPRRTVLVTPPPPVILTPEQQKAQIDDNIKGVSNILSDVNQTAEEKKAMLQLIQLLQQDKKRLENEAKKAPPGGPKK